MFIVIEGLDGAGKSTQVAKVTKYFTDLGKQVEYLHFPRFDAPVYGEMVAKFLRGEYGDIDSVHPQLVALIYAGDRADAKGLINGWLEQEKVVVIDRYLLSNVAYQCAKSISAGEKEELKKWILDTEFNHFTIPKPDLTIFLDVPFKFTSVKLTQVRKGEDRDYLNGKTDIHEASLDFQSSVRLEYLKMAKEGLLKIVDCSDGKTNMDTPDNIFKRIENEIKSIEK